MSQTLIEIQGTKLELTQRHIAEALPKKLDGRCYTPATIGAWWRGEIPAPVELADDLAKILKTTRDAVLKDIHAVSIAIAHRRKSELAASAD